MITLQDAIERAKLAADVDGIISSYAYEQLIHDLADSDRHAFTMALVDLGLNTRRGSKSNIDHISRVLYGEPDTQGSLERQFDILDEFRLVANMFTSVSQSSDPLDLNEVQDTSNKSERSIKASYWLSDSIRSGRPAKDISKWLPGSNRPCRVSQGLINKFKDLI